jgi:hypothetical protein
MPPTSVRAAALREVDPAGRLEDHVAAGAAAGPAADVRDAPEERVLAAAAGAARGVDAPEGPNVIDPSARTVNDPPPPPPPAPFSSPVGSNGVVGKVFEQIAFPPAPPPAPAHGLASSPGSAWPEDVRIVPQKSFVGSPSKKGRGPSSRRRAEARR